MSPVQRWSLLLLSVLVAGCSTLDSLWLKPSADAPPPGVALSQPPSAEQEVLQLFDRIERGTLTQPERELAALEKAFELQPLERHRLRLAVILGFADCGRCQRQRALALLGQSRAEASRPATRALAGLLLELLEARSALALGRASEAQQQRQIELLQQKLDALTSIEESLHRRERAD